MTLVPEGKGKADEVVPTLAQKQHSAHCCSGRGRLRLGDWLQEVHYGARGGGGGQKGF